MREIKFRAWHDGTDPSMLFVGDGYGTTHSLDCCKYFMEKQPVTLMQYTGLKDVNGVEIYEGDILKVTSDTTTEIVNVFYFMGNACWRWGSNETGSPLYPNLITMTKEVIGNIYEHPELLEGDS